MRIWRALALGSLATLFLVAATPPRPPETRIGGFARDGAIERQTTGNFGLYIRAADQRWYYAAVQAPCPRLSDEAGVVILANRAGDLDRDGSILADGVRCRLTSLVQRAPDSVRS